jgi:hypothetical protein
MLHYRCECTITSFWAVPVELVEATVPVSGKTTWHIGIHVVSVPSIAVFVPYHYLSYSVETAFSSTPFPFITGVQHAVLFESAAAEIIFAEGIRSVSGLGSLKKTRKTRQESQVPVPGWYVYRRALWNRLLGRSTKRLRRPDTSR